MINSQETKDRIIAIANELYSKNPSQIPKVADVRKLARTDMNTTSEVMKDWRENLQRKLLDAPYLTVLPYELQQEIQSLTHNIWHKLQLQANSQVIALTEKLTSLNDQLDALKNKHLELQNEHRRSLQRERKLSEKLAQLQNAQTEKKPL